MHSRYKARLSHTFSTRGPAMSPWQLQLLLALAACSLWRWSCLSRCATDRRAPARPSTGGRRGARGRHAGRLAHAVRVAALRDSCDATRRSRVPAGGRSASTASRARAVQPVAEARVLEDAEGVRCDPGALPAAIPRPRVGDDPRDAAQGHARLHLRARARRPRHRRLRRDRRDVRASRVGGEAAADEHRVPSDGDALRSMSSGEQGARRLLAFLDDLSASASAATTASTGRRRTSRR